MKIFLAIFAVLGSSTFGLVEKAIDERRPIEVVFSSASHNRIAVEGGSVEKVFGDSGLFSIAIDPATGNAFVNVTREIKEPTTLSVVTSSGAIQDLLVSSFNGPSEHVRLLLAPDSDSWMSHPDTSIAPGVNLLNQIMQGSIPPGYGQREWEDLDVLELPAPLVAMRLRSLEGPFEVISVYEIVNPGDRPSVVTPEQLKKDRSWVFLNGYFLDQHGKAMCITGRAKNG